MPMSPAIQTQACEDRDFVEWHRGCPWCAVWVARADVPEVAAGVAQARACIAPWLLSRYERQPHVTLAYRGLMAGSQMCPNVEFDAAQLRADVQALQSIRLSAFELQLQGVGSFSTVPYLAVHPHAALHTVHAVLAAHTPYPGWSYVPHVTVGHYACEVPLADVLPRLQDGLSQQPLCTVPVRGLWLARYRTDDIAGVLSWEGYFDLYTQSYHAQPDAILSV